LDDNLKKDIRKIALQNAAEHNGKTKDKVVLSKSLGTIPELKSNVKDAIPEIASIVSQVNGMSIEEQKTEIQNNFPEILNVKEKPKEERVGLPPLEGAEHGKVVTRFTPAPNGYPHIGHAKAAIISEEYAKMYDGKIILDKLKKISVVPQPYQKPHPPIWQVVDSPSSIKRAAELGINCIMWIPTVKALKERFEIYKNAKSETEKRDVPMGEGICLVRDLFIADSMEEAKELAGKQMVDYMRWVCHWRGLGSHMDPGEELPKTKNKLDLLSYDFLHKRNMLFGTPEYVIEKIKELKSELNLQNLQVWSNFPGVKHEHCMKSIKLFTEKVMPHFKDKLKTEIKKVS